MSVVTKLGSGSKRSVSRSRRHSRVRKKVTGTAQRPRLVVFRSTRHVEAQIVDDTVGRVLDLFDVDVGRVKRWGEDIGHPARRPGP